ncbi:MAG: MarR family winged helix-turn-helix transcriptional regulator [Leucobacter sp.]
MIDTGVLRAREAFPQVDPLAMNLLLKLNRAASLTSYDLESAVYRPRGLTWPAFRLLLTVWAEGPLESKAVAANCGMSRAAVSSLTNTLETQGLLERGQDARDKRKILLSLTEQGTEAVESAIQEGNQREKHWVERLTREEQLSLEAMLQRLVEVAAEPWVRRRD